MKIKYAALLLLLLTFLPAVQADPIDSVVWIIKQNNMVRLSQLLAPTVEITLNNQEETYSRPQATAILTRFFTEHKVERIKLLHKVNTNQKFLFGVAILNSNNGVFRIAYTLNQVEKGMRIIEMRIEIEKTK